MRIVVSGTHASGKSTLIDAFAAEHPEYRVLPDPFEDPDLTGPQVIELAGSPVARLAQLEHAISSCG
ncbi:MULTISPECIES: hypothetical protein [unclassified Microbacterium]|uniref:hypothetical protein n=1 Tax=unclassified Microbacterium TaxID=2609290 RepID=UPI0012F75A13|nr:hypothetical protein [Microbacterium sp. MAH-37]MVQ43981.1 hypothetical protein [Microbacterium sp. MAH-37]